jgi:hypothetical protein
MGVGIFVDGMSLVGDQLRTLHSRKTFVFLEKPVLLRRSMVGKNDKTLLVGGCKKIVQTCFD